MQKTFNFKGQATSLHLILKGYDIIITYSHQFLFSTFYITTAEKVLEPLQVKEGRLEGRMIELPYLKDDVKQINLVVFHNLPLGGKSKLSPSY